MPSPSLNLENEAPLMCAHARPDSCARRFANIVLPVPGGPHKSKFRYLIFLCPAAILRRIIRVAFTTSVNCCPSSSGKIMLNRGGDTKKLRIYELNPLLSCDMSNFGRNSSFLTHSQKSFVP